MKMRSLLTVLLSLMLVLACSANVFAAEDYDSKAKAAIKAELSKYVVLTTEITAEIDALTTEDLQLIQANQGELSAAAAQASADIKAGKDPKIALSEAQAKASGVLNAIGISIDLEGVTVDANGNVTELSVSINGGEPIGVPTQPSAVTNSSAAAGTGNGTGAAAGNGTGAAAGNGTGAAATNPVGSKTGDGSMALALICLAVVGGALTVGARKSFA